jgi:hypothetical protein
MHVFHAAQHKNNISKGKLHVHAVAWKTFNAAT